MVSPEHAVAYGPAPENRGPERLLDRVMPDRITRWTRGLAWATLVSQIGIIGTGGLVRLTGSGLGCPTWPRCTPESFVNVPEMGIHGVIEFGNRLLTFVLVAVAILTFLSVLRTRATGRGLVLPAFLVGLYIPAQAVLGGITVLTGLNPYIVGAHFLASIVIVCFSTWYVWRVYYDRRDRRQLAPTWVRALTWVTALVTAVTLVVGVLTTGSGPHAGDSGAARNDLDPQLMQHVHSWPAYALLTLVVALIVSAYAVKLPRLLRYSVITLVAILVQIAIGITQSRLGLPAGLVGIHMVVSALIASGMAASVLALRQPAIPADRVETQSVPSAAEVDAI